MNILKTTFALLLSLLLFSCGDDNKASDPCTSDFDQSAMLQNIAEQIIVPEYLKMSKETVALKERMEIFLDDLTAASFEDLTIQYLETYEQWQRVAQYNFGPAEEKFLRNKLNNFPLNVSETETNIQTGVYNFDDPDTYDKGFPALDYLLFGLTIDPADVLAKYQDDDIASVQYRSFLRDLVNNINSQVQVTHNSWVDSYQMTFVENTGSAAGSSLSLVINALNENYELIKREKIGIPSGALDLGFTSPERVEAYYSGASNTLALAALEASQELYLGGTGLGLDDYLNRVKAKKGEADLNDLIKAQFTTAINSVRSLSNPLSTAVDENQTEVQTAYDDVNEQIVLIKTDMPSVLCVSITYIDNPSDSD